MRIPVLSSFLALASSIVLAQQAEIPLRNWTVPPYTANSPSGIHTMVDATPPRAFIGTEVCRALDTRIGTVYPLDGDGAFAADATRTYNFDGVCGVPVGAEAVSLNITVTNTGNHLFGHIKIWPANQAEPTVSTLNWSTGGVTESNAAIIALSPSGTINVKSGNAGSDVIIDVNGYFSDTLGNPVNFLQLENLNSGGSTGFFRNISGVNNSSGVRGLAGPGFPIPGYFNAGVRGESLLAGVLGISQLRGIAGSLLDAGGGELAWGVVGFHVNISDPAISNTDVGVFGNTSSSAAGAAGVVGYAPAGSGRVSGARGLIGSGTEGAAGVRGQDGGGDVPPAAAPMQQRVAGVRGESRNNVGVLGLTDLGGDGACGMYLAGNGEALSFGCLGVSSTTGLLVLGDSSVSGMKSFIEPHPTDASKMIRYISLEGNEVGTYFRGKARFQNGIAVIEVPEDFRIVTDAEGLSIQVTPIGDMATVAVQSIGLDRIVVRGSRNVEFFYTVNGIRHAYKDVGPIGENEKFFVPRSADEQMPAYLPAVLQQRLISNGTYRPDGTVNMETARRLGWDKVWEQRSRLAPQPAEP